MALDYSSGYTELVFFKLQYFLKEEKLVACYLF